MDMAGRAIYRTRQFLRALLPRIGATERAEATPYLPGALATLFESMPAAEQRHGLDVFHAVRRAGHTDADLLTAALLHDVGKGRVRIWQRVAYVVLSAASPALLRRLAAPNGAGWRRAFDRMRRHPELGARLVEEAGGSDRTVALIARQEEPAAADPRLAALRAADEVS